LSARPVPPSSEVTDAAPPPADTPVESEEQLSALAGLITRALESADQLAAVTRRRKGSKVASEPDGTDPAPE
ncbi:MAG TPA: hypothetical protein VIH95_05920, partial [Acidimicrobiales bacterium]